MDTDLQPKKPNARPSRRKGDRRRGASAKLDGLRVWSRDKVMRATAEKLRIAY